MAGELEQQANDPECSADPKWLRRRAEKLRALALKKEKALERKSQQ